MAYLNFDKTKLVNLEYSLQREIIRTNRTGSYACTTIIDCNTRKYHGLLICPLPELDGGRHVLLSSLDETVIQHEKEFNLGLHKYAGDTYEPKGHKYIRDFSSTPLPKLVYNVGGVILSKEKVFLENEPRILIKYTLEEATSDTRLRFRPFLAFRNIHQLSKANMDVNTKVREVKNGISSRMYQGYPDLFMQFSKKVEFVSAPDWYFNIEYIKEQKRGYDYKEDLFVPGYFEVPIKKGESIIFSAGISETTPSNLSAKYKKEAEKRIPRDGFENCLMDIVEQFFIHQGKKTFVIAGYPWLPIRSRDTFIALPGLVLPSMDSKLYHSVINSMVSQMEGHLFPDIVAENGSPNFPVDTPLWFIWSLQQFSRIFPKEPVWELYGKTVKRIIEGYLKEKEHFYVDTNSLIYEPEALSYNSWMNGEFNNQPTIFRNGYKVEINALWYNAIGFSLQFQNEVSDKKWIKKLQELKTAIETSFNEIFWTESRGYLADFVNADESNIQFRPNQLLAAALPFSPLTKEQIKSITDLVSNQLMTPYGIRTLSPEDPEYSPKYKGNHEQREKSAYNGSVWPWLFAHYIDALWKINKSEAKRMANDFIKNFEPELQIKGIGSISELYHADPPQKAKGAISFAMNTGELIRMKYLIEQET
ncbi:MAG TPA: amylo-alpha-1,6-glucosidase [Marinilabiliales bacterium]|nr:MAG: hypothetical protein A2W95_09865 [Bacteroidetes bacterium GWA2_40_14]OFX56827.1 MAG: hypothetical protein A2W84_11215 [Bacteroidetes bacterium GWC2_40_13]OFX76039.1 MAG: hypothetical protein A2W96_01150 [Bacteroidetes bacterium GWD2_40_43]OFX94347.1 MAG: hypothetical protein A2W97_19470 [Bacteroidetes bacterium GWE2_40_63]OFY18825.1 MAG: hypothetical protein A2W88_06235 [Bacteroidetes bacterium GWF2_40_13]OFZ24801.1 MAG: hypothetical protein A2437_15800 [Bacteroidetes bacterium RIFOXYC